MEEESETFRDTIEELRLVYITLGDGCFTWKNKRTRDIHIASLLERFLVPKYILDLRSELHSSTLPRVGSNDWPIELMWSGLGSQFKKTLSFEQFWIEYIDFDEKNKGLVGRVD